MENIETLRASLVQKIFSTENIILLEAINKIFSSTETEDKKYKLSENQKNFFNLQKKI
jgi:hypothetical protein